LRWTRSLRTGDDVTDPSAAVGPSAEQCRDHLLAVARDVVREATRGGHDPATIAGRILAAWLPLRLEIRSADHDFELHASTGVEAMAFVVRESGTEAGGVILRLRGELPDSFEAVALAGPGPHDPMAAWRAFFDSTTAAWWLMPR
jgi:hypothetical protein